MLNKLLKRCVPWMDKGRWIQIRVLETGPTDITPIYNDREIESVEVTAPPYPRMVVTLKHIPHIIDYKIVPVDGLPYPSTPYDSKITYESSESSRYSFYVELTLPGTYWFFVR